ncbi:single-stranded DNA-binding protein [Magnetococcales bacterium HHB-1]
MPINHLELEGIIASAIEVRTTPSGRLLIKFELEHESFVSDLPPLKEVRVKMPVTMVQEHDRLSHTLKKGMPLIVRGRLNQNRWIRHDTVRWGKMELFALDVHIVSDKADQT